jgi:pilus assembly protein Flp/PilA
MFGNRTQLQIVSLTRNARASAGDRNQVALDERIEDMQNFRKFLKNSKGATAIEYGLIAALIAVAAITAMKSLGGNLTKTFSNVSKNMGNVS